LARLSLFCFHQPYSQLIGVLSLASNEWFAEASPICRGLSWEDRAQADQGEAFKRQTSKALRNFFRSERAFVVWLRLISAFKRPAGAKLQSPPELFLFQEGFFSSGSG